MYVQIFALPYWALMLRLLSCNSFQQVLLQLVELPPHARVFGLCHSERILGHQVDHHCVQHRGCSDVIWLQVAFG